MGSKAITPVWAVLVAAHSALEAPHTCAPSAAMILTEMFTTWSTAVLPVQQAVSAVNMPSMLQTTACFVILTAILVILFLPIALAAFSPALVFASISRIISAFRHVQSVAIRTPPTTPADTVTPAVLYVLVLLFSNVPHAEMPQIPTMLQ